MFKVVEAIGAMKVKIERMEALQDEIWGGQSPDQRAQGPPEKPGKGKKKVSDREPSREYILYKTDERLHTSPCLTNRRFTRR